MNFLTYLDPSNDAVDNDGDPITHDNPLNDLYDNDGDGTPDPADTDENKAQHYEQMVAGRININTAPWFVLNQLPWVALQNDAITPTENLAQAIVAFRDKTDISAAPINGPSYFGVTGRQIGTGLPATEVDENPGFKSIAQLMHVINNTGLTDFDIRKYLDGANLPGPPDFTTPDVPTDDLEERDIIFHRVSNLATVRSDVFTAYILIRVGQRGPQKRVIAIFDRSNVFDPADTPKLLALHPVPDPR